MENTKNCNGRKLLWERGSHIGIIGIQQSWAMDEIFQCILNYYVCCVGLNKHGFSFTFLLHLVQTNCLFRFPTIMHELASNQNPEALQIQLMGGWYKFINISQEVAAVESQSWSQLVTANLGDAAKTGKSPKYQIYEFFPDLPMAKEHVVIFLFARFFCFLKRVG